MFTRILTDLERKRIESYLAKDGEREALIRLLVSRAKAQLPAIESDVSLLKRLLATYMKEAGQSGISQTIRKRKIHKPKHRDLFVYRTHL